MKNHESFKTSFIVTLLWYVGWCAVLLPSCAPKVISVEPITPKVSHLRASIDQTATASTKVATQAQKTVTSAESESVTIDTGVKQAEALKNAKTVTPEQLEANAKLWRELHTSNALVVEATKQTVIDAHEMTNAAQATSVEAVELQKDALVTDKGVVDLKTANASLTEDAGAWKKLKWTIWIIGGILFIMFIAYEVLPRIIGAAKPPGT